MSNIAPHPKLVSLSKKVSDPATLPFSGFVAPSPDGVVRLCEDLTGSRYIDFREADIVDFTQNEATGITELFVNPFSVVTVVSTVKVPLTLAFARSRVDDGAPDGGPGETGKTCVEKRVEKCKKDPDRTPEYCDSEKARNLFEFLCKAFGDPAGTAQGDTGIFIA